MRGAWLVHISPPSAQHRALLRRAAGGFCINGRQIRNGREKLSRVNCCISENNVHFWR